MEKVQIKYPCKWGYKVIGTDENFILEDVAAIFNKKDYDISKSKESKLKKYISFNIRTVVLSEQERNLYFQKLGNSKAIKIVI